MNRKKSSTATDANDAATTLLGQDFFRRDPLICAQDLIGCELVWGACRGIVVETEAYAALGDEACHTFLRRGAQKFVDEHPAGTAYVYLNYGVHWLLNVLVKGCAGAVTDGFVLIRALEPTAGFAEMRARRGPAITDDRHLCSGPGKLTQALGVPPAVHGQSLCVDPARGFYARAQNAPAVEIVTDVRIGISRAAELPWRFLLKDNPCISRSPARAARLPEKTKGRAAFSTRAD